MKPNQVLLAVALLWGCTGESVVNPNPSDADADADADTDADADVDAHGDDIENAYEVVLDDGIARESASILEGDSDFFKVDAVGGNYYMFWGARTHNLPPDQSEPDTVCRVYNADGQMIAENDDMPRRQFDTDCSMITYAAANTTFFVEVLEWSDWDTDTNPEGAASWTYDFVVLEASFTEQNENDAALGTDNDSAADAQNAMDDEEPDYWADPWEGENLYQFGTISEAGDVDVFGARFEDTTDDPFEPSICQWGMYPDIPTDLDARFRLLDEDGNQLAVNDEPDIQPVYDFLYKSGITFPVAEPGDLFLEVTDQSGSGSANHWYAIDSLTCYPAVFDPGPPEAPRVQFSFDEESNSSSVEAATILVTREYDSGDAGGSFVGFLETVGDFDSFKIEDNLASGQVMTIFVEDIDGGSVLTDATVTLWAADGVTALESADGPNAEITYNVNGGGPFFVTVESKSGVAGDDVYYLGNVFLDNGS